MNQKSGFLELQNGFYDQKSRKYYYNLLSGEQISFKNPSFLVDPTYYSSFQILFGNNECEKELKDFLNAILFPRENESKIENIKYLTNEFYKLNGRKNKIFLMADITCEVERDGEIYDVVIEMKKVDKGSLNKRLFNYGTAIRNNNNDYKNFISLSISCSSNISSNGRRNILNYIQTIEINVDKELSNMANNKPIEINGKDIGNDGKEFLKLIGLKSWAIKVGNRYAIPNYKEYKLSTNSTINKCFEILSSINNEELTEMILDQQYYNDIVNENREEGINFGLNKGLIIGAFSNFKLNSDLDITYNYLKENGVIMSDESQIRAILNNKDKDTVDEFIKSLKFLNVL